LGGAVALREFKMLFPLPQSRARGLRARGKHTSSSEGVGQLTVVAAMVLLRLSVCSADVVKGIVTDSTSHQAIANVLVQEAGTGNVTLTDGQGRFTLEINAAIVQPRDGKSPNHPAPAPSVPAVVSRKGGYASRWTSVALGDTNITVQLARELETAGPSAALFANPYHVWVMNSQVHRFGQSGIQENGSEWFWNLHNHVYSNACTVRIDWQGSGISRVVPATVPNYTPSAMDNYWAPFRIVDAYNLVHDNYGQQGLYAGQNTDGNGIIYDTFRSYAGQSLCLGNIACHNGGKGIHVFRSGRVTVANNTAYNNNWDTCNPGTWRAEISAVDAVGSTFINNIAWATRGPGVTAANAPFMAHSGSSNTWANNLAYGAPNDFADPNAYPSPANQANVDPLLVDVAKGNFALKPGSPAVGFGTLQPCLPPQCTDVGACSSTCTSCP